MSPHPQLPLGVGLPDGARLESFHPGPNALVLEAVRGLPAAPGPAAIFVHGPRGSGRSHLLQGACAAAAPSSAAGYIGLADHHAVPRMLEGWEGLDLVCLDDLDAVAGDRAWEAALFSLVNRLREAGGRLLVAADGPPGALPLALPDLRSRLTWGPVFGLERMDDEDRIRALMLRASRRGLELPADSARYLITRHARGMDQLQDLLERLDRASLAAQRKLTVPFLRELLGSDE